MVREDLSEQMKVVLIPGEVARFGEEHSRQRSGDGKRMGMFEEERAEKSELQWRDVKSLGHGTCGQDEELDFSCKNYEKSWKGFNIDRGII